MEFDKQGFELFITVKGDGEAGKPVPLCENSLQFCSKSSDVAENGLQ